MSKQYYAIQKSADGRNELKHWKYIRREKMRNGKYRYYYAKDSRKLNVGIPDMTITSGGFKVQAGSLKPGERSSTYYKVKDRSAGDKDFREVNEYAYKKALEKSKSIARVGEIPLRKVAKEQIAIGAQQVKDLLTGKIYTGPGKTTVLGNLAKGHKYVVKKAQQGLKAIKNWF